jgi:hypothetical protein
LKRAATLTSLTGLSITFGVLSAIAPLMLAQDPQSHPSPVLPSNILGPQLIVWSQLQKPEPLRPAVRTFTGTIVNDRGKYVLKITSGSAYQLDDQQKARQYEWERGKTSRHAGREPTQCQRREYRVDFRKDANLVETAAARWLSLLSPTAGTTAIS